jgi:competence protein ComEA
MGAATTLWKILDHQRLQPDIIDSHELGTKDFFSRNPRPIRWKLGWSAALVLIAGIVAVVVLGNFARSLMPAEELIPTATLVSTETEPKAHENIVVHVVGAVAQPGVVTLPASSRVADALARAGGARADAELAGVNLARILFDGEQIVVPFVGDPVPASGPTGNGPISLSRADKATLETLPRIGPATAERIIRWRESHGPFLSVEDVLAIPGIGPATVEGLQGLVVP